RHGVPDRPTRLEHLRERGGLAEPRTGGEHGETAPCCFRHSLFQARAANFPLYGSEHRTRSFDRRRTPTLVAEESTGSNYGDLHRALSLCHTVAPSATKGSRHGCSPHEKTPRGAVGGAGPAERHPIGGSGR